MSVANSLTAKNVQALAETAQPICLIGSSRKVRWDAMSVLHREWLGKALDLSNPHPDLSLLLPAVSESSRAFDSAIVGGSIGIDAVREFVGRLCLTPYSASIRVGMVEPASALTLESQNALLRYIEEPTRSSRIILSTPRAEEILPTLRSRCMLVRLPNRLSSLDLEAGSEPLAAETQKTLEELLEILDNPDGAERLAEFRLAKPALQLYESIHNRRTPDPKTVHAFMEKQLPAGETMQLFSEIVFSALCTRLRDGENNLTQTRKLLELQSGLRYHPPRAVVLAAIQEWLESEV